MNTLLIVFALPIAVIIISIALQKIFKCPFLVAAIIFAIFLIVTFVVGNLTLLVATIAYTILAFITAILTNIICRILQELDRREEERESNCCSRRNRNSSNNNNQTQLLSITRRMFKILQSLAFYVKLINAKHFRGNNNVRDYRRYIN